VKILSLNMNMFNYDAVGSFFKYLREINPDIAIIQECRFNRLDGLPTDYNILLPNNFSKEKIDNRIHFTLILCKDKTSQREDIKELNKFDYSYLKMTNGKSTLLALHLPYRGDGVEKEFDKLLENIRICDANIICGDFNASRKKPNENYNFMCDLVCNDGYVNLWEFGAKNRLAQIVDYSGEKILAEQDKEYRTYSGNTHINYFLAKNDAFALNSIMIDNRTLAFTDHCGIFVDLNMK